ncbi:hypothetical protein U879_15150 [Defluviimonas sp. 20V17]|uniref:Divergent polysaccharide deacetylase n=1 Tax=Allgaiera indica TaxID=765699 RepID=A0AAN4UR09_9RHOB|nr:divergent polysaccharide deacetylase family protein [Allgaiera indica]KDB02838.1 hypothetical protein U879_15150 [Defluviimonas sp. 20V17]GHE01302.1 hypothetical protein GCM10008024_16230 [Allgaiera indica]SDW84369.1 hypothetical protein SAMN05444006_10785 [Allgaiera indica]
MASGFVKGALAGVVVSGLGLSVVSELAPPPAPQMRAVPESPAGAKTASAPRTAPETGASHAAPPVAPPALVAAPNAPAMPGVSETAPAAPREAASKAAPAAAAPLPGPTGADRAPAASMTSATAPEPAPEASLGAAPGTEPAAMAAPSGETPVTESAATRAPQAPSPAGSAPGPVQAPPKLRLDTAAPAATALLREDRAPNAPVGGGPAPVVPKQTPRATAGPATPEAAPTAEAQPAPLVLRPGSPGTGLGPRPQPQNQEALARNQAPRPSALLPKVAEGMPRIAGAPQPGFGRNTQGVVTDRLPTVAAAQGTTPSETTPDATTPPAQDDAALPAYRRYAVGFENPQQKPLLSIILIDTGGTLDRAKLAALPMNITFAIDPAAPDAAAAARLYRAAGHEVVILARGIPASASDADLRKIFARYQQVVPQAIGVLDSAEGGFEADRGLSQKIVSLLAERGLALLTYAHGLDAAHQIAQVSDLPAARIYRRLDAADENPFTITRYLDRAAFKAAQEGRVTVLGHTRPDTIEGLKEWAGDSRARTLALAPVTATLTP